MSLVGSGNRESRIAVFLGPTLAREQAQAILDAWYYPPVTLGDLYSLLATDFHTVLIIDGLFDGSTPVWQREVLALLEAGKRVAGASSMGALRAVELHPYGMQGIGQIYRWYRDGIIDGDDEVALLHANEQLDHMKLSEPLVNIRHNLGLAARNGIITQQQREQLVDFAKARYFGDRNCESLVTQLRAVGECGAAEALAAHFDDAYIDLKAADAREALALLAAENSPPAPLPVSTGWFQRPDRLGSSMHDVELQLTSVQLGEGRFVKTSQLLENLVSNWATYQNLAVPETEFFFLQQTVPVSSANCSERQSILQRRGQGCNTDFAAWLECNAMHYDDWAQRVLQEHAVSVALRQDLAAADPLVNDISHWLANGGAETDATRERAAKMTRIAKWAENEGFCVPDSNLLQVASQQAALTGFSREQSQLTDAPASRLFDLYSWLILEGPARFGYTFELAMAVFRRLQMQGRLAELS